MLNVAIINIEHRDSKMAAAHKPEWPHFFLPPAGLKTWDPAFIGGLLKEHDCALSCAVVFPISEIFSQLVAQLVTISAHYSFQTHFSLRDVYGCSWGERLKKFFVNSVGGTGPSSAQPSHITP